MASTYELLLLAEQQNLQNNTPQLITSQSIGVATASATFTIPSGKPRVQVNWRVRSTVAAAAEQLFLRMNGDSAAHYLWEVNQANNATNAGTSSAGAVSQMQVGTVCGGAATANYFSSGSFLVDGVTDVTNFATVVGSGTAYASTTNSWTGTYGGQYLVAGAITSLTLLCASGNIAAGSSFSVYGLPA